MVFPLLVASFLVLFASFSSSLNSDGLSLLALKAAISGDLEHVLDAWSESDLTPCGWVGVTCVRQRVTGLILSRRGFTGYIPSELGAVVTLRRLSLSHNNFSKPIPSRLFNATSLVYLDLSHNSLSGSIPPEIETLKNLTHLDLSSNRLNGSLPEGLSQLKNLGGTLNLSNNQLSGKVPASYGDLPVIVSLDLRQNNLTGKIPQEGSLVNQGPTAFTGNPGLCGFPLETPCPEAQNPSPFAELQDPKNPENPNGTLKERGKETGAAVTIPLISGVSAALGVVSVILWLFRKKGGFGEGKIGKEGVAREDDCEGQKGKFVVVDEGFGLDLEDLLRASAYVVGKSRSGIVYKVVVGRGSGISPLPVVAVRRLSEGDGTWRFKEFESEVEAIANVRHPNIVPLRAYYYADDEKLLVSDFIRNGSLYTALHGGPSTALPPLSWGARLKIAQGVARGLMHIHECSPRKYVHGNLKSSKILLDDDLQPYIAGFGLMRLMPTTSKSTNSASKRQNLNSITSVTGSKLSTSSVAYIAPEARVSGSRLMAKCDVYSFGIVLLEILTGRQPEAGPENDGKCVESLVRKAFREECPMSEIVDPALLPEVHAKKQVVAAFYIALNCTELDPELRPRMRTVSESLDHLKLQ
ncbi:receptor protein kinase-like protein ZAR1 [Malania oleifera]|uniref:receptor protein kinase-like protein ZAR1 n=1 Tax=Malania oleifera TaxID=397392 RepID=UPI0025AE9C45|nr:receptor protein kinase-like protein ZAR1 [Malania oleifera]